MKVVLASGNQGKLREIQSILSDSPIHLIPQSEYKVPEAIENGLSFVENAIIKARFASQLTDLPAIADDSGIELDALNGAPGIYSARYAGQGAGDKANNAKLLQDMLSVPDGKRQARFQCVIVFMRHHLDPMPIICQGTWEGELLHQASGDNGFGYDPLFYVPEQQCSSAQLSPELKNSISHRGQALALFARALKKHFPLMSSQ
ncbi:MAG: RdgB/HAM1 family non-canonical purine NTP pyrophosphatase [Gammaproteobacteria bacterium]|nr:RdgB/HAM1 family non-canonical purine NTP pyrophosphatase [Gammaproteobacteria bacterium]MDH5727465.1 RdgB/HAM1 family non-canonical purine NTP pyrophosphatase [Gammaproteobacteria bacterium]